MNTQQALPATKPADMQKSQAWMERYFSSAAALPIAFKLNGQAVDGLPAAWQPVERRRRIDANIIERVFEARTLQPG